MDIPQVRAMIYYFYLSSFSWRIKAPYIGPKYERFFFFQMNYYIIEIWLARRPKRTLKFTRNEYDARIFALKIVEDGTAVPWNAFSVSRTCVYRTAPWKMCFRFIKYLRWANTIRFDCFKLPAAKVMPNRCQWRKHNQHQLSMKI